ncbi:hypothetical protein [Mycobacteroides abscessus]|uniref:hypothetical protein n=1 Tax=Mycobacteroides abscessus TaxID=36809 RepID=UPI0009A7F257|nr:hypothetical protein [Mycobacteroides abscessus]SLI50824.1 Phage terminase-like protein, large subunit [Mycobacteroides abscessus subsp. abscessus]
MASIGAPALLVRHDYSHVVEWYRHHVPRTAPPTYERFVPERIGPTWDWDAERGWKLPEHTLGWEMLGWTGYWLKDSNGQPWQWTMEQARMLLWYWSLDETGRVQHPTVTWQRLKGHGKDPLAAGGVALPSAFAPCIFDHWGADGQPVGRENNSAWVQVLAVDQDQTKNTLGMVRVMLTDACRKYYGIVTTTVTCRGMNGSRLIEGVTSNPLSIEGNRTDTIIRNETQNWNSSNNGKALAEAAEGNRAKISQGRSLDICNAFRPNDESVGQEERDAWEATQDRPELDRAATFIDVGHLYDSLEAPPDAPFTAEAFVEVVEAVRGDSYWIDPVTARDSALKGTATPSEQRRKWYNQIVATDDDWMDRQQWDACKGDRTVDDGERIAMFLDCSKTDDATALMGCRLSDGHVFTIGIWAKPTKKRKPEPGEAPWMVSRPAVDQRVREARERWRVVAFWCDPSGARDDETGERFWDSYIEDWRLLFGNSLTRLPAVKTGPYAHPIIWDMRNPIHTQLFVAEAERFVSEIKDKRLTHDRNMLLRAHALNAKRAPGKYGVSLMKKHRESAKKIDAAVAAVGARLMYHQLNAKPQQGQFAPGRGRMIARR